MKAEKKIRLASESDASSLLDIYSPFVKNTVITFEYEAPTVADFRSRISNTLRKYPWLVCEIDDRIVGYAYASQYSERLAYDWSATSSIYVDPNYSRRKIATELYHCLFALLKLQGFYNVYAAYTLSNKNSAAFHESLGFKSVGIYHNVGYKFGEWHDVKWCAKTLREHMKSPEKPKTILEISQTKEFAQIISKMDG